MKPTKYVLKSYVCKRIPLQPATPTKITASFKSGAPKVVKVGEVLKVIPQAKKRHRDSSKRKSATFEEPLNFSGT